MLLLWIRKPSCLENKWGLKQTRMMWKTLFSLTIGTSPLRIGKNWRFIEHDSGGKEQSQDETMTISEFKEIFTTFFFIIGGVGLSP
jgi:hypothetical protein